MCKGTKMNRLPQLLFMWNDLFTLLKLNKDKTVFLIVSRLNNLCYERDHK